MKLNYTLPLEKDTVIFNHLCLCVQVRIVAGRPMHCQVPGIEYTMGKRAVQTMLEGATAIALSYNGVLYIAETDEKKIHRIRQVISCFRTHMAHSCTDFLIIR